MKKKEFTIGSDSMNHSLFTPIFFGDNIYPQVVEIYCCLHHYENENFGKYSESFSRPMLEEIAGKATGLHCWQDVAGVVQGVALLSPFITEPWFKVLDELFTDKKFGWPGQIEFLKGLVIGIFEIAMIEERNYQEWSDIKDIRQLFLSLFRNLCLYKDFSSKIITVDCVKKDEKFMKELNKLVKTNFPKGVYLLEKYSLVHELSSWSIHELAQLNVVGIEVVESLYYGYAKCLILPERFVALASMLHKE